MERPEPSRLPHRATAKCAPEAGRTSSEVCVCVCVCVRVCANSTPVPAVKGGNNSDHGGGGGAGGGRRAEGEGML